MHAAAFTRSAKRSVADGEMVLESTMIMPSRSDCSAPSSANSTRSTAAVSATQIQTTSASFAASAGETAVVAPSTC